MNLGIKLLHEFWGTNHTQIIAGSHNYDRHSSDVCGLSDRNRCVTICSGSPRSISWPQANCFITPLKTCVTPASILLAFLVLFFLEGSQGHGPSKKMLMRGFPLPAIGLWFPSAVPQGSSSSIAWALVRNANSQVYPSPQNQKCWQGVQQLHFYQPSRSFLSMLNFKNYYVSGLRVSQGWGSLLWVVL